MSNTITILWADDEIELLKPHILFLENKGYDVHSVNSGIEAIEKCEQYSYDIIFLDEQMPGLNGLETLEHIKKIRPNIPVVMITKSEAEDIMEAAIGLHIHDYLIKPVNPNQILLSIKKNVLQQDIITHKATGDYQKEFTQLGAFILEASNWADWIEIYKKLTLWDIQLAAIKDKAMSELLRMQQQDANNNFAKFIKKNYVAWLQDSNTDKPIVSANAFKNHIFPHISQAKNNLLLVIDNLRYDHWLAIRPLLAEYYTINDESLYYSILPTSTQYARNAFFAGLMPLAIADLYPTIWKNDSDDESKNQYEQTLFENQLKRLGYTDKIYFEKITAINAGKKLQEKLHAIKQHNLSVIIYNFVDTLSHARTDMDMIKELANDAQAYRSLTKSWFAHSQIFELLKEAANANMQVFITTDHGSIQVNHPIKVQGDKSITTNLRYKQGKALLYNEKEVFEIKKPQEAFLPSPHISSSYIFAYEEDFFAYPNNFNQYAQLYTNSFQHGGISLEEMIIPSIQLHPKLR